MTTDAPTIDIRPLVPGDRAEWERMFRAYLAFCQRVEPDEMYERSCRELLADGRIHALAATADGQLAGIAHFLVHPSTSGPDVCFIQYRMDLP